MTLAIIIDIVFILLIVVVAIIGLFRGFAKSLISMVGTFGSLVLAILAAKPLASLIDKIFKATNFFAGKISAAFYKLDAAYFQDALVEAKSGATIAEELGAHGVGTPVRLLVKTTMKNQTVEVGESIGGVIGSILGKLITLIIAVVVAFILIRIILFIISKIFDRLGDFAIIGGVDKTLGFVLGAAKGLLYCAMAFGIVSLLTFIPSVNNFVNKVTADSKVAGPAYKYVDEWTQDFTADSLQKLVDKIRGETKNNSSDPPEETDPEEPSTSPVPVGQISLESPSILEIET